MYEIHRYSMHDVRVAVTGPICVLSSALYLPYVRRISVPHATADFKLNTIQLVTPVANHCCLMANDVQN